MSRRAWITMATVAFAGLVAAPIAGAATRLVGPGHPYAKPCQAIAAAISGDTIQIDAAGNGGYDGDVCATSVPNLTIEGVNGRAHIDAAGRSSGGKAIWVLAGPNTVVRNVELSGAAVPDRNGAAIRLEGDGDLTLSGSYIHHNEDGILVGGSANTDVVVDSSEFSANGFGDGQSHNIYISRARSFTMRYSYSHGVKVGHLVKSRAAVNDIFYNRLSGESSTSSYELDLPNGGLTRVVGNVIQQGPNTNNSNMLAYAAEGASNPSSQLSVVNNTFVNDRPGNATAVFVGGSVTSPVSVVNNISVGQTTFVNQPTAHLAFNCLPSDGLFVNRAAFDYHLQQASPCRDAGTASIAGGLPSEQYVYDLGHEARSAVGGALDAGAFEWAPPLPPTDGGGAPGDPAPTGPPSGGGSSGGGASALTLRTRRVRTNGNVVLVLHVSGPGALTATAAVRGRTKKQKTVTYAKGSARPKTAGKVSLTLKPTTAGRRTLRTRKRLTLSVTVRFKPADGAAVTRAWKVILRHTKAGVRGG